MAERSGMADLEDSSRTPLDKKKIILLANFDLFAECLMRAVGERFSELDVVGLAEPDNLVDGNLGDIALILFYRISSKSLAALLQTIHACHPRAAIGLVVSDSDEIDPSTARLVEARLIHGVLPLNLRLDVCLAAIELLMKGGEHFPSALLRRLSPDPFTSAKFYGRHSETSEANADQRRHGASLDGLTTREVQILDLICMGTQNKVVAARLGLSENTVKVHVRHIFEKLNVRNRTEAVSRYFTVEAGSKHANR